MSLTARLRRTRGILRRRTVRWILLRLFRWLETLTMEQLRLLWEIRELQRETIRSFKLQKDKTFKEHLEDNRKDLERIIDRLPLAMSSREEETMLEDLQLMCREMRRTLTYRG